MLYIGCLVSVINNSKKEKKKKRKRERVKSNGKKR